MGESEKAGTHKDGPRSVLVLIASDLTGGGVLQEKLALFVEM